MILKHWGTRLGDLKEQKLKAVLLHLYQSLSEKERFNSNASNKMFLSLSTIKELKGEVVRGIATPAVLLYAFLIHIFYLYKKDQK